MLSRILGLVALFEKKMVQFLFFFFGEFSRRRRGERGRRRRGGGRDKKRRARGETLRDGRGAGFHRGVV